MILKEYSQSPLRLYRNDVGLANNWIALGSGAFAESINFQVFDPDEFQAGFDQADIGNWRPPGSD